MKRLLLTIIAMGSAAGPVFAQTATPPPAPAPMPTAAAGTIKATLPGANSKATPAPPKDVDANRVGISGVWEIAIQQPAGVVYTHFKITQAGTTLTGQYLDEKGKKYPLSGSVDGKTVRLVVTLPTGNALVFEGSQDQGMDMVGTLNTAKDVIGFTASYRPKYKWIDNLAPGTSGMGTPNGVPY